MLFLRISCVTHLQGRLMLRRHSAINREFTILQLDFNQVWFTSGMSKCCSSPVSLGCLTSAPGGYRGGEFAPLPALSLLDTLISLTVSGCDLFSASAICVTLWMSCWGPHVEFTMGCQDLSHAGHVCGTEAMTGFLLL